MKIHQTIRPSHGLTLLEVLVVIMILVLIGMLIPTSGPKRKAPRISCVNNLKQIGLAYRIWEDDHGGRLPSEVAVTNGGVEELFSRGSRFSNQVFLNYLTMSNELSTPKVLYCPADEHRTAANTFSNLTELNISYFAGLDAEQTFPQSILSGDDNLLVNGSPVSSGILVLPTNAPVTWTAERHIKAGNIGLADGSAQQVTSSGVYQAFQQTSFVTNRFIIP